MLLISRTLVLMIAGNALGFFTKSGIVKKFSVRLSDVCRSIRVESNTIFKTYIGHDVLLINEVHNVNERKIFGVVTTIYFKIMFWTQNRMNCQLCRFIGRDLVFCTCTSLTAKDEVIQF